MDPSSSSTTAAPESRPQAGPLPRKRGEIGYSEEALREAEEGRSQSPAAPLPDRHPEDRQTPEAAANPTADAPAPAHTASASVTSLSSTNNSVAKKKRRILAFLDSKKVPSYGGLRLTTLLAFFAQVLAVTGTIVGWVFTVTRIAHNQSSSPPSSSNDPSNGQDNGNGDSGQSFNGASMSIFVYVVFGVATLVQLLFIERRVFRLRAERYSYVHPGEILPSARTRAMGDPSMGFSPWNRPPLPTYAAALAQSGVGTGDVEDHIIAVAPPPAYGNTRGSTFLLSGFLRDSLRAQRPVSAQTQASQNNSEPTMAERPDRPVSYVTVDEDWEEIQNAERARRLEETLSALERPAART